MRERMKKKWLAVLLCGCLVFAGCGSDAEEEASNNDAGGQRESGGLMSGNRNNNTGDTTPTAAPEDGEDHDTQGDTPRTLGNS